MKTEKYIERQAARDRRNIVSGLPLFPGSIASRRPRRGQAEARKSQIVSELAFTLVELLVVIAIITVIAALLFPVVSAVKRQAYLHATQSEMAQIETAIERYHAAYGFYPPHNTNTLDTLTNNANILVSPLYYELTGTRKTTVDNKPYFVTLDGSSTISTNDMGQFFGTSGFMNCSKPGADASAPTAQNFLPDLKPDQIGILSSNANTTVKLLVASVGGPAGDYTPLGEEDVNPWRYVSPGIHNPSSYDLWVQLVIGARTNLICNWTKSVQINTSPP